MPAKTGYPAPPPLPKNTSANDNKYFHAKGHCPPGFAWDAKKQACVQVRSGG